MPRHSRWYSHQCSDPLCPHATLIITIDCSRASPKPACSPLPVTRVCAQMASQQTIVPYAQACLLYTSPSPRD
eukprot:3509122-Alexandrium_andersonii.AAC.1